MKLKFPVFDSKPNPLSVFVMLIVFITAFFTTVVVIGELISLGVGPLPLIIFGLIASIIVAFSLGYIKVER